MMTEENMKRILEIGVALSSETDLNRLLGEILSRVMELTGCDAGTLYLKEGDYLKFTIMRNLSMRTCSGEDGTDPGLPPVKIDRSSVCALALLEDKTICEADVRNSSRYDFSGPIRYDAMTGYYTKSMLVVPMKNRQQEPIGVLQLINALDTQGQICEFSGDIILAVESVASQAAIAVQNVRYLEEIKGLFQSLVRVMSHAVDERTPYNASHTRHMVQYADVFVDYLNQEALAAGQELRFDEAHKQELLMSIWFHDIGKLVTPLEVMNKNARLLPMQEQAICHRFQTIKLLTEIEALKGRISEEERCGRIRKLEEAGELVRRANTAGFQTDEVLDRLRELRECTYTDEEGNRQSWMTEEECAALCIRKGTLSEEERKIMEEHVVITDRLLSRIHFSGDLSHVREWASGHHELLNGSGYPKKLFGDQIPEEVRIITLLDIFDALVADDRPYKPGMPVEKALMILKNMAEKEGKLDPALTDAFVESRSWEKISNRKEEESER